MKKTKGSVFTLDDDFINSLNNQDVEEYKQINYGEEIKTAALKFINNINIDNDPIEVIDINYENFTDYHYKLMGGRFLAVKEMEEGYQYITSAGICFNCVDERVIQIVKDSNKPTKVSYQYCDEVTVPLALVVKILYGRETKDIADLVAIFAKDEFDTSELNCYRALTKIYKKLFNIITIQNYSTYFNLEKSVYLALYKANLRSTLNSTDEILIQKNDSYVSQLKNLNLPEGFIANKDTLLPFINNNTDSIASLNDSIGNKDYIMLYNLSNEINELEYIKNTSRIKSYNSTALIDVETPVNYLVEKNITTVKGRLPGLYFNTLLSVLKLKDYQVEGNNDILLINYISSINPDTPTNIINSILLVLEAYICNKLTPKDITKFIYDEKHTVLNPSDVETFLYFLKTELSVLMTRIDNYNNSTYKSHSIRLIEHKHYSPLHSRILEIQRKIIKSAISEVFATLEDFNSKNKLKLYISDVTNNSIYIISPSSISHLAIDILNRTLLKVLQSNLKLNQYITYTDFV